MLVNNDSSVPVTDYLAIFDTDETNIATMGNTDSNLRENEPKTLISRILATSMNFKDLGMWLTSDTRSVRYMIVLHQNFQN